jgi:hypothetical protein
MKQYFKLFVCVLFVSCSTESKEVRHSNKVSKNEYKTFKQLNHISGVWRIDSIAENVKYNVVANSSNEEFEAFHFRNDEVFSMIKKTVKMTSDKVIGRYSVKKDSIFIFDAEGVFIMKYGYRLESNLLILNGDYLISTQRKVKPTFFLSKMNERDL